MSQAHSEPSSTVAFNTRQHPCLVYEGCGLRVADTPQFLPLFTIEIDKNNTLGSFASHTFHKPDLWGTSRHSVNGLHWVSRGVSGHTGPWNKNCTRYPCQAVSLLPDWFLFPTYIRSHQYGAARWHPQRLPVQTERQNRGNDWHRHA